MHENSNTCDIADKIHKKGLVIYYIGILGCVYTLFAVIAILVNGTENHQSNNATENNSDPKIVQENIPVELLIGMSSLALVSIVLFLLIARTGNQVLADFGLSDDASHITMNGQISEIDTGSEFAYNIGKINRRSEFAYNIGKLGCVFTILVLFVILIFLLTTRSAKYHESNSTTEHNASLKAVQQTMATPTLCALLVLPLLNCILFWLVAHTGSEIKKTTISLTNYSITRPIVTHAYINTPGNASLNHVK